MLNETGQTLLEVTIALGIAVIIITGLTIVTLTGLRNAQYAQNQAQATKLAQDWIEQVRSIRDQNVAGSVCGPTPVTDWTSLFAQACSSPTACNYVITSGVCRMNSQSSPNTSTNPFSRLIIVEDYGVNQKRVTSQVSWNDFSGTHKSVLVEVLSKP